MTLPISLERTSAGLPPSVLAVLAAKMLRLRAERAMRVGGKSVVVAGHIGDQPVVAKVLADDSPQWRAKHQHEIAVYKTFAKHHPPLRVPRLVRTDGERILVLERIPGAPLDTSRYPTRVLSGEEVRGAIALVGALAGWQPRPDGFTPALDYTARIARYHADGLFDNRDRAALERLLTRCGQPSQLCHGDPLPSNMLITPNGEWVLLDWEYTGLFLPGFDLAMLHTLFAATPAARDRIETIVAARREVAPFLVNLAIVLAREFRIHNALPEDDPLRRIRLPVIQKSWGRARDLIRTASGMP
ncbi:MAG TPA: aminoglycoside phosphotransferase family protein [Streptosporangiaceae bacterium]|nr:aminoglycoside phosphotransferase family protein [Streptosporangiaceae bacterium]